MSTARAGMVGFPPTLLIQPVGKKPDLKVVMPQVEIVDLEKRVIDPEKEKYQRMWALPDYGTTAPGEDQAGFFVSLAKPTKVDTVIDFGCGTGRGALMIAILSGCKVQMVDFVDNSLDEDVRNCLTTQKDFLSFHQKDLREPTGFYAKYGYCTDVLEHIPPEDLDRVINNVLKAAQYVFFQISTVADSFGEDIGEELHLSVHPYTWWIEKMHEHDATILWSGEQKNQCAFYVTGWQPLQELIKSGVINTSDDIVRVNIKTNVKGDYTEASPHEQIDEVVIILAGGPSMNQFADEIVARRMAGEKLVTVNGAYNWAIEHGIVPSAQIMVDSRDFNKRFLQPVKPNVIYMLASQCDPEAFASVPKEQTLLWHSAIDDDMLKFMEGHYLSSGKVWYPIVGGSTVMLRAIPLLTVLGRHRFEIYGFDSCLMDGKHHSYVQEENDGVSVVQVLCNGRTFHCHPWMVSQAQEFLDLMRLMAEHIELIVHGDGLIAWLIQSASDMEDSKLEVIS